MVIRTDFKKVDLISIELSRTKRSFVKIRSKSSTILKPHKMNKKNLLKSNLVRVSLILTLMIAFISCDQEKVMPASEYPSEITSFVSTHFPNNSILQIVKDSDGMSKKYEVLLSENISLKFDRKKEVTDIDGNKQLPDSVIPEKILQHVMANYPDNFITDWELDDKKQKVKLDNGLELEFNKEGNFLKLDN